MACSRVCRVVSGVAWERIRVALFGNKESAAIAALQQQLTAAHATIAELRGWVGQLRGAETAALEVELRGLRSAVEQSRNE